MTTNISRLKLAMVILGVVFTGYCFVSVFVSRMASHGEESDAVLKLCHYNLQPNVREAIAAVIDAYEEKHPGKKIAEIAIPESVYPQALRTQLIGNMAPDIFQLGHHFSGMSELKDTYVLPITPWVDLPNSYNRGTKSENTPWRETFIDGLRSVDAYSESKQEYYGISLQILTIKIYYNRELLENITGRDKIPETYGEFLELCAQINRYARETDSALSPVAGSKMAGLLLLSSLFSSVNQKLYYELSDDYSLSLEPMDYPEAYLRGQWNFRTPSIRLGLGFGSVIRECLRPGFMQMGATDANFQFLQKQAVMVLSFSNDGTAINSMADFEVGVGKIPLPGGNDPRYSPYILGPLSEAEMNGVTTFAINRRSSKKDLALDFLKFLGSVQGNAIFARHSGFFPVVDGVKVSAENEVYRPVSSGYHSRFYASFFGKYGGDGLAVKNQHLLFAGDEQREEYIRIMENNYAGAMVRDIEKDISLKVRDLRTQEVAFMATYMGRQKAVDESDDSMQRLTGMLLSSLHTQTDCRQAAELIDEYLDEDER